MDEQIMYDFVEDADDRHEFGAKVMKSFYDFCWNHFRNQMRVLIVAFCASDGKDLFEKYLENHGGA